MCAVILLFAFTMSLIINVVERMIVQQNEKAIENEPEEVYATKKPE